MAYHHDHSSVFCTTHKMFIISSSPSLYIEFYTRATILFKMHRKTGLGHIRGVKVWSRPFLKKFSRRQNWIFGQFWPVDWKKNNTATLEWSKRTIAQYVLCSVYVSAHPNKLRPILELELYYILNKNKMPNTPRTPIAIRVRCQQRDWGLRGLGALRLKSVFWWMAKNV